MRRVPCLLDPIGEGSPRLRHAKQRSLALGALKLVRDLEAVDGAPPVERYEFAGRHPPPQYVFPPKTRPPHFVPVANKKIFDAISPARTVNT
jgi:hypothetical protein